MNGKVKNMPRKKCHECLSCFQYFWIDGKRYYHCWLCGTTYEGRDDDLHLCPDPRAVINVPVEVKEQENEPNI